MKTLLLSVIAFLIGTAIIAQQVPRDKVVVEITTGTWCSSCPAAAIAADNLVANGYEVAIMENHGPMNYGDPFANTYSVARNSYYGNILYPTAMFDGVLSVEGGSYQSYLSKYNQRIAIPSSFTLAMNGFNDGLDYTVVITAEKVDAYSGTNLVLQFGLTESEISYSWQGQNHLNFVNRLMVPNAYGTPLNFSDKETEIVTLNFTIDASWVTEHCELVTFIQDNTTKEILQGTKVALPDLMPMYYDNAGCLAINMVPVTNCSGEVAPKLTISNEGAESLTTLDINYKVNNENLNTYEWTGVLSYGEMEAVDLPAISFNILDDNDLLIYTTNPNGNPDEDTSNDTLSTAFVSAMEVIPDVYVFIKLDENPDETTWEFANSSGQVLHSGGPYPNPNEFIKDTLEIAYNDCFTFTIFDEGGDGLVGQSSGFTLRQSNFALIYENNNFTGSEELVQFSVTSLSVSEMEDLTDFYVYPNPFEDYTNVSFTLTENENVELIIYNVVGEVVFTLQHEEMNAGVHNIKVNADDFTPGIYFVNLKIGDIFYTKKISMF